MHPFAWGFVARWGYLATVKRGHVYHRMISPETAIQFHSAPDMVVENSGEQALVAMEKAIAFQYEMYEEVNEDAYVFNPNVRTPEGEMHVQLLSHEDFTLNDVESIFGNHLSERQDLLERVDELVRSSLICVDINREASARYSFYKTIRVVAEEHAAEDPLQDVIVLSHSQHFAARALASETGLDSEIDNLLLAHQSAVHHAVGGGGEHAEHALAIAVGLQPFLSTRGLSELRKRLFEETLAALSAVGCGDKASWASAHLGRGRAREELGDPLRAQEDFSKALELANACKRNDLAAAALTRLGATCDVAGDTGAARKHLELSLSLCLLPALKNLACKARQRHGF